MGTSWDLLGTPWGLLRTSWRPLGASWGALGPIMRRSWGGLGSSWGGIDASWVALGVLLDRSWAILAALGAILGWLGGQQSLFFLWFFNVFCNITFLNQDGHLDGLGGLLGASWAETWPWLRRLRALLGCSWTDLGPSWPGLVPL